jgi:hypothetical protein
VSAFCRTSVGVRFETRIDRGDIGCGADALSFVPSAFDTGATVGSVGDNACPVPSAQPAAATIVAKPRVHAANFLRFIEELPDKNFFYSDRASGEMP